MPSTRRRFVACGVAALSGLAGCRDGLSSGDSLRELHLGLSNRTDGRRTLHFALEAADGLGEWHEFELTAGAERDEAIEPSTDREWERFHAVAGDHRVSGDLFGESGESACLRYDFRLDPAEVVALYPSDQSPCGT
ncbi:hypothetical protein [Halosimplex sp. TS25]|uniref:hypothetical protein n=1 Tax=Halosimplex rarum TaxID=3396619 RepID=UPI0039E92035